jgi:16S rRNA (cytidine1402-2'-O)-methyltransferase
MQQVATGTLYIVSTPIGTLADITLRALETLKSVDLIAAEDTRRTRILTSHYDIKTPLTSYYEYNKISKGKYIIDQLTNGKHVALVSDAGTPGISDPGYAIIRDAIDHNIPVVPIPGPTALITALVISGKPTHRFSFEGFLPVKKGARRNRLKELAKEEKTRVIYESPHRLLKTLGDIQEVFGDVGLVCARELTKKFEEVKRGSVSEIINHFTQHPPRGEFIIII